MKAVFLIKSPLQLMNAIEARHHYGLSAKECILLLMADRKSQGQLLNLVEGGGAWGGVVSLPSAPLRPRVIPFAPGDCVQTLGRRHPLFRSEFYSVIKLRFLATMFGRVDRVFLGDQKSPLMRHFANCTDCREVLALDDGTATLKYARERMEGLEQLPGQWQKRASRWIKRSLLGLHDDPPEALTFFSVYSVELPAHDRLEHNDYRWLRNCIGQIESVGEVYFLGAPLVEAEILSEEEYFWHLQQVKVHFGSRQVRYVAHRREHPGRVQRINERFGWQTTLFDFPIEYQLAMSGPRPAMLAAFFSSALDNCRAIFGELMPVLAFRLSPKYFANKGTVKGEGVETVYEHYEAIADEFFQLKPL